MELKRFQQRVIDNLEEYIELYRQTGDASTAYSELWESDGYTIGKGKNNIAPYCKSKLKCPDVCLKIPTGGGKTFVASAALKPIIDFVNPELPLVLWLVPSSNILEQTLAALKDPRNPYHQRIARGFERLYVFDAEEILVGGALNPALMYKALTICVLSYSSLRSNDDTRLRMYRNNGKLLTFSKLAGFDDDSLPGEKGSVMRLFNLLKPVIVLDESHNAKTTLSRQMLEELNPSFIIELTATPDKSSNPISVTSVQELKDEHMVKLPIILCELDDNSILRSTIDFRNSLENMAQREFSKNGRYVRPIALIQAEPKIDGESETFEKVRNKLIKEWKIPEEQIALKVTGQPGPSRNELMSPDCPVRYIITVNALKEGWDCPFAYILSSIQTQSQRLL